MTLSAFDAVLLVVQAHTDVAPQFDFMRSFVGVRFVCSDVKRSSPQRDTLHTNEVVIGYHAVGIHGDWRRGLCLRATERREAEYRDHKKNGFHRCPLVGFRLPEAGLG